MARKMRRYSDQDRVNALAALAANAGNLMRTARQLNMPEPTLRSWANGRAHPEAVKGYGLKKGELADKLEQVAWQLVEALPDKIGKASLKDTAIAAGIAMEKMQLLRQQPTSITASRQDGDLTDDQRLERLRCLIVSAQSRRLGIPFSGGAGRAAAAGDADARGPADSDTAGSEGEDT